MRELFADPAYLPRKAELPKVAERFADMIYDNAIGAPGADSRPLLQTSPLKPGYKFDLVSISGGIGACMSKMPPNSFAYGDIGPLLAEALLRHPGMRSLPLSKPASTVRATVIGAGSWSLSLSGSTVWAEKENLPLRNIPVVIIPSPLPGDATTLAGLIRERVQMYDIDPKREVFALFFGAMPANYASVQSLSQAVAAFYKRNGLTTASGKPHAIIVALREDIGKAVGMELRALLNGCGIIVIDEVRLSDGDFLDLGRPLTDGGFMPLVVKSLAFNADSPRAVL